MKKISLIIIMVTISIGHVIAQETPVDQLFDKYAYKDGYTTVYISKYMFGLFKDKNEENSNDDDFDEAISGLESIRILTVEDELLNKKLNFFDEVGQQIPFNQYKKLMVVKEKNQDIKMLIKEVDGHIVEFLMLGGGEDNFLISITGKIDLKSISKISESMDIEGLENIDKLEE